MVSVGWVLRGGCAAMVGYLCYLSRPGSSLFSLHPALMTLAFTGLMTEAVFTFSSSGMASGRLHSTKVMVHWALLGGAAVAHGVAFAAIYYNKENHQKPHFASLHGILGLATSLLFWVQLSAGVFSKYPKLLSSFVSLRTLRAGHGLSGTLTFALGMATLCLGVWSVWFQSNAPAWASCVVLAFHSILMFIVCLKFIRKFAV